MAGPWERYQTPQAAGPWSKYGATPEPNAASIAGLPDGSEVLGTTEDGGRIYQLSDGTRGFTSPGFSTTDPSTVDRLMQGATPAQVNQDSFDQQVIGQNPIASRLTKFVEGYPAVGSYVDEAIGAVAGDDARNAVRATSAAMDRQNPNESTALGLGGTVLGAAGLAAAAGPTVAAAAPQSIGAQAVGGAALGGVTGAAEGAIYGAGRNEGEGRLANAQEGAVWGGAGGAILGGVAPYAAQGIKSLLGRMRGSDVSVITRELGVSRDAAKVIKTALDAGNIDEAADIMARAGDNAMLADMGTPAQALLDAAANTGGPAGRNVRRAVENRASQSRDLMEQSLDRHLGVAEGQGTLVRGIREGTADARSTAYDAAYSQPIDYSVGTGRYIERLMQRVPKRAIDQANELMRREGVEGSQIMASIADDGSVTFQQMPDVRQLDYITRALNDVADAADGQGKLGGSTQMGAVTKNLSREIRQATRRAVPEYGEALDIAADAISRRNAVDTGRNLLLGRTTRETIGDALQGASQAEKDAMRQGVRSYIDDTLANVSRTISDQNGDAREAMKLVRDMSSRANRQKLRMLMGGEADALLDEIDNASIALDLRAAIAQNSKTAVRQSVQGTVDEITSPGIVGTLTQGEPVNATKRIVQALTGNTPEAQQIRQMGIYDEIARALTETRGDRARHALRSIERAMRNGEELTERQARFVASTLTSGVLTGSHEASRTPARLSGATR